MMNSQARTMLFHRLKRVPTTELEMNIYGTNHETTTIPQIILVSWSQLVVYLLYPVVIYYCAT